jgi:hypothetical protein
MKVHDIEIPQQVIDAAVARMRYEPFRSADIERVVRETLGDVGCKTAEVHNRTADRLIQRERKAGRIVRLPAAHGSNTWGLGRWLWVGEQES